MARPPRTGLDYFNLDCNQEDNLNFIEAKHGLLGYGVVVKIWKRIYQFHGYYCEWNEKNVYLFAREVNVPVESIREIVESCLGEGLFNRELFEKFSILTSRGTQKRWKKIVLEAKRKVVEVDERFSLLPNTREETPLMTEETGINSPDNPQRKEKKIKVNLAPAQDESILERRKEELVGADWNTLVQIWRDFVKAKFGTEPLFSGEDPRRLKSIVRKLEMRCHQRDGTWDTAVAAKSLRRFLVSAYCDKWLASHFSPRNLDAKFEEIERNQSEGNRITGDENIAEAVNRAYTSFLSGNTDWKKLNPDHFEWLKNRVPDKLTDDCWRAIRLEAVNVRINQLLGSNQAKDLRVLEIYQKDPHARAEEDVGHLERIMKKKALVRLFSKCRLSGMTELAFQSLRQSL